MASVAAVFADPTTVAILKHLIRGSVAEADLAERVDASKKMVADAVDRLVEGKVLVRDDGQVKVSHHDVTVYLLTLIGAGTLWHMNVTGEVDPEAAREEGGGKIQTRSRSRKGESEQEFSGEK